MKSIFPDKLKKGDEIRIVAPARSLSRISKDLTEIAVKRLEGMGFNVTFGKNVNEMDEFASSSIKSRVEDLHKAFSDKNVKMILPAIGGFNSNQLLRYLDYDLIKKNPKIIGGFSDLTALQNAIYAKTGLVTYSSPAFSTFGMKKGFEYIQEYFDKCLIHDRVYEVNPSKQVSYDSWYKDQENRNFEKNSGPFIINEGSAEGKIIGGNLCTLNLLHGTEYMPSLENSILFIEDDSMSNDVTFDRDLQSLIHQPGFEGVKGIVIGRFEKKSEVKKENLVRIVKIKEELKDIPVIADLDFGHSSPMITFPIGGKARINALNGKIKVEIIEH